jgi:hypothetical protein
LASVVITVTKAKQQKWQISAISRVITVGWSVIKTEAN